MATGLTEQRRRAYLHVLYSASIYVRFRSRGSRRMSDDQLHDLMDAIHNVPDLLMQTDSWFTDEMMRANFFAPYDERWASEGLSLIGSLEEGLTRAEEAA